MGSAPWFWVEVMTDTPPMNSNTSYWPVYDPMLVDVPATKLGHIGMVGNVGGDGGDGIGGGNALLHASVVTGAPHTPE